MNIDLSIQQAADHAVDIFSIELGGVTPSYHIKTRPDGHFLMFEFAKDNNRLHKILEQVNDKLGPDHPFYDKCAIITRAKKPADILSMAETRLLQKAIGESLTIDRHSFGDDFFSRYTPSVANFEQDVTSVGNHIVFGRRGAGKSSLLAYSMHTLTKRNLPFAWIAMQTYANRDDENVICSVLAEMLAAIRHHPEVASDVNSLIDQLELLAEAEGSVTSRLDKITPRIRRQVTSIASPKVPFTLFLDDFHVVDESLQPRILHALYSVARGNNMSIKLSGIEQFTKTWDEAKKQGLQSGHDARVLKLDLNLTMPDRSKTHIVGILNAHANYCGLPSISYLTSDSVLSRLVLVAAAVPRDALSLFAQAINKANIKGQKEVTLVSLNAAASEMAEGKLQDIEKDASSELDGVLRMLEVVKTFCISEQKRNSFLVKIQNSDEFYKAIQKLIALRLVHVLHEGITPHKAGQRFMALMLDYGFYIGIRASRSVKLFPTEPKVLLANELRKLPIFKV